MNLTKKSVGAYIAMAVVLLALGICFIAWPSASAQTVCALAGAAVALFGIVKLISYFVRKRSGLELQFDFALGIIALVLGLTVIAFAGNIVRAIPVFLGIFILVDGVFKLQTAFDAKRYALPGWWVILAGAVVFCVLGLVLILHRSESAATMTVILGVALVLDGIQNLVVAIHALHLQKKEAITVHYREGDE